MISSADFRGPLLGTGACAPSVNRGGATRRDDGGQPTVAGEIPWPPAGKSHGRQRGYFWPSTGRFSWPPTGGAQLFPGSLATPTPQSFSVASPPAQLAGVEVALPSARACAHCCPAHIHQVGAGSGLTGV